jgi:hypothetical protein
MNEQVRDPDAERDADRELHCAPPALTDGES